LTKSDIFRVPRLGDFIYSAGWWPSANPASGWSLWENGRITGLGAEYASITTSGGLELSRIELERIHWRPKLGRFVCFSNEVHASVQKIKRAELVPQPNPKIGFGDYILCYLPHAPASGWVLKRVTHGFLVALPGGRRWIARDPWITFDDDLKVWVAKGSVGTHDSLLDA
jgi:hypothetical protein